MAIVPEEENEEWYCWKETLNAFMKEIRISDKQNHSVIELGGHFLFRSARRYTKNELVIAVDLITRHLQDIDIPRYDRFRNAQGFCVEDYEKIGSDWIKGHVVPAANHKYDEQAYENTFFMTNVVPEAPDLNALNELERKIRAMRNHYDHIFTIHTAIYGEGLKLLSGKIPIPKSLVKIVCCVRTTEDQERSYRRIWYVFKIRNKKSGDKNIWKSLCTFDEIKQRLLFNFNVPETHKFPIYPQFSRDDRNESNFLKRLSDGMKREDRQDVLIYRGTTKERIQALITNNVVVTFLLLLFFYLFLTIFGHGETRPAVHPPTDSPPNRKQTKRKKRHSGH